MIPLKTVIFSLLITSIIACTNDGPQESDIVLENEKMRLVISSGGIAKSLIYKPSGEEFLMQDVNLPAFSLVSKVNYHDYDDRYKANLITMGEHEFYPDTVYIQNNNIIIHFDVLNINAVLSFDIRPQYIQLVIDDFVFSENKAGYRSIESFGDPADQVDKMWFLRLPVNRRNHFGRWLNVIWDDQHAVSLLGSDPYALIDSESRDGCEIIVAGCDSRVRTRNVGACIIAARTENLLDNIDQAEKDFNLPKGVANRRREESGLSSYWTGDVNRSNIDDHIIFARKAGFRTFFIYYTAFSKSPGHFEWRDEYPNGIEDLKEIVRKIENAGMIPGVHIHYNKAGVRDSYVTPVPDPRLNITKYLTLGKPLNENDTTIYIIEDPGGLTLRDRQRILKIGNELVSYSDYSASRPFRFTGCKRGELSTKPEGHKAGTIFGPLDMDGATFVRLNQNTGIREEVADRLADIYNEAGFKFVYFDGAEDVHSPYWFNCPDAQWTVYRRLTPEPIFAGGAMMAHFSWHMLTRGNHYDSHLWPPEEMKKAIRDYPGHQAPLMADNFTASSFGRYQYFVPGENTIGLQPDMLEYLTSRAAAWDAPWILKSRVEEFKAHPRTPDNFEVIKRWEDAKEQNVLTVEQKQMLRNMEQEHILLINEQGEFELVPYEQINNVAQGVKKIRAFIFERKNELYVVYWHSTGESKLELPVTTREIVLLEELGRQIDVEAGKDPNSVIIPADKRRYIKTDQLSKERLIEVFRQAHILNK